MDRTWFRIVSWHAASGLISRGSQRKLLCGRWAAPDAEQSDELPSGKSCESCLRAIARQDDGR
jgi:hypothetical protein